MTMTYTEPLLSVAVLDFCKPIESRLCLQSVKDHIKFPHRVIFCDNGSSEDYAMDFVREGLVDQLIVNRESTGLGLGTRDLFAACHSALTLYLQNDQIMARDLTQDELADEICGKMYAPQWQGGVYGSCMSVSLAGAPCGVGVYSERAHIIETQFYKNMEEQGVLGYHGAGKYHDGPWREAQIQALYKEKGWMHYIYEKPLVQDNGVYAVRDMGEAGVWVHRTDSKALWCIVPPKIKNPVYPKLSDVEFAIAAAGEWPDGRVPEVEVKDSFRCWDHTMLARMEREYVADLRRRFAAKHHG